jgi:hypothetical protein
MIRSLRIVAAAIATLAIAATAATAMPAGGPIHVRSLAGPPSATAAQKARASVAAQERYYQSSARPAPAMTSRDKAIESIAAQERAYQAAAQPVSGHRTATAAERTREIALAQERYYQGTARSAMTPPAVHSTASIDKTPGSAQLRHPVTPAASHKTDDDNPSPLVFILPTLGLLAMLAAATAFVRSSGRARRSHARA